jgi:hypothetical protein
MIKITAVKKIKDEEFEVTFSVHRKQRRQTLFYHKDLWIESLEEFMPYYNPKNMEFQPFLRNNPTFTKKIFEIIAETIDGKKSNFPIMLPLEWEEDSQHLKAA